MTPARLFFSVVTVRRRALLALLACAAGVAAGELAIPWCLQLAVDAAIGQADAAGLDRIGLAMLAVVGALYALHCGLLRLEARVLHEGGFSLRRRLYTHLLGQPLGFFTRAKSGELVHRVVSDTAVFQDNAVDIFSDLPFEAMTVAGVLALMAVTSLPLAAVAVGFLLVAAVISAWVGRPLPTLRKTIQGVAAAFSARLQDGLTGIRTVKAFGGERHEIQRLDEANRRLVDLEVRSGRVEALLVPVFDLMELLGVVLVVWYGAHLIVARRLSPGGLVAFIAYMEILAGPVSRVGRFYRRFQQCRAVAERLAGFLSEGERVVDVSGVTSPGPMPEPWPIVFSDVTFTYPGADRPAVQEVSLAAGRGEVVAVVGRNGAGKSTLMDLLLGFYAPASGRITAGGVDLRHWSRDAWRRLTGVMSQEVFLFHATLAENIAYGRPDAALDEIRTRALEAGLGEVIARLPAGLQTVVGERGSRLSGGERQRVALARLFLKDPAVVVFDEPTAHLDGEALRAVGDAIDRLSAGRTVFLIAHRSETIRYAHRVVVLDAGHIVAEGAHEALLASEPLYSSLLMALGRQPRQPSGPRETALAPAAR